MAANIPRLIVGAVKDAPEIQDWSETSWAEFVSKDLSPWKALATTYQVTTIETSGYAEVVPFETDECRQSEAVTIALTPKLAAQPESEQVLTLLHETIHVELIRTSFRDWYKYVRKTAPSLVGGRGHGLCVSQRGPLAVLFLQLPDEIAAERYFAARYPNLVTSRLRYLLARRNMHAHAVPALRSHALLYDMCYRRLGAELATDADQREEFRKRLTDLGREFEASSPRFAKDIETLLDVRVDPPSFDGNTFLKIAREVQSIDCD